jgi:phenylalanyl-tRNA synthetase alpha chain
MDIDSLTKLFAEDLARAGSEADLRALRDKYLSRKSGLMSAFMKAVAASPAQERPALGQAANQLKQQIEASVKARLAEVGLSRPAATRLTSRSRGVRRSSAIGIR